MVHPNKEIIRTMFTANNRGDTDTMRQLLSPKAVYHIPGQSSIAGDYYGPEAILELRTRQKEYLADKIYKVELLGLLEDGDQVAAQFNVEAASEGKTFTWRGINLYDVRDGRITECWIFIWDLYAFDDFWS